MASRDGVEFYMIRNWTQHQHYKNKRPTWIKVYTHLLTDMKFRSMCDSSKLLLFHLWLLAATNGNKIRLEMCNLRSITGISNRKLDPSELIENNYLVPYDSRLALDGVYTREEKRREEHIKKRREEKRPQTPFDSKAFNLFWSTYPKKVEVMGETQARYHDGGCNHKGSGKPEAIPPVDVRRRKVHPQPIHLVESGEMVRPRG